jgi:acetolactate synthase I/II/III large subunit
MSGCIKVSDYIAHRLATVHGIRHVFMVTGGGAMHLNDSFGCQPDIQVICNHHEQACAMGAEGYARVNQQLAVVNVTTGPGGINAMNGLFGQWTDSAPVLYLSGQVKTETCMDHYPDMGLRQLGDQEADIIKLVAPITKLAVVLTNPADVRYLLDKAVFTALNGRMGPVWLDVPINIQAALIDPDELRTYTPTEPVVTELSEHDSHKALENALQLLKQAERPLLIAGHGIRLAGMANNLPTWLDQLGIPVVTTFNGMDLVASDHPLYVGRIGTIGNRAGNFALQTADVVLSLGSRNNIRQISYNWRNFAKNAQLIMVDVDPAELNKPTLNTTVKLALGARVFMHEIASRLTTPLTRASWISRCQALKDRFPTVTEAPRVTPNPLEPYAFIHTLTTMLNPNDIVVAGNGTACVALFQTAQVVNGQRYFWNSGNASMGFDLPAAIGACFAANRQRVICLAGDGSLMMNLQELQTLRHYNLPIKLLVLNNQGYSSIRQTQANFFEGRLVGSDAGSGVSMPNFTRLAEAFDLPTMRLAHQATLSEDLKMVLDRPGPVVCEVMLTPDYGFAPKLSARKLADGTMQSPSLEDMSPFLERNEYEAIFAGLLDIGAKSMEENIMLCHE